VVRVADKAMILGVTDGQVTLLTETDLAAIEEYQPEAPVRRESLSLEALGAAGSDTQGAGAGRTRPATAVSPDGPLSGSILSVKTFTQTWDVLRERMVRKP
jgi:flagellar protein FliO/FliZ